MKTQTELLAALQRFLPIRVVLRLKENKVHGLVEHSFAMDIDPGRVNIFWSGKAYSMLGEHTLNGEKSANSNRGAGGFVIDPLADTSPIEIDWETWLAATDKFGKRNAPFTVKPFGEYVLRAAKAEGELAELQPRYTGACKRLDEYQEREEQIMALLNPITE